MILVWKGAPTGRSGTPFPSNWNRGGSRADLPRQADGFPGTKELLST